MTGPDPSDSASALVLATVVLVSLFAIGFVATGSAMGAETDSLAASSPAGMDGGTLAQDSDRAPEYNLSFEPGNVYSFGIPAPSDQTFAEAFDDLNNASGALLTYETDAGWSQITNLSRQLDAQEGYLLSIPADGNRINMTLEVKESEIPLPGDRDIDEGWNFITPTRQDHLSNAFEVSEEVFTILDAFENPSQSPGYEDDFVSSQINLGDQPIVDPFAGYFVSASGGLIFSDVNTNMTQQEADEALNIDSDLSAPYFDVEITDYDEGVPEGETVTVEYQVTNTGDRGATQDIDIAVDGTVQETIEDVTLYGDGTFTETFTYQTDAADAPGISVSVASENETESRGITVLSGTFADQATVSSTITDGQTDPGVVVQGVNSNRDSTVLVTYEASGATVVAGMDTFTATELDGSDLTIPIDDTGGFPGNHTAHVVPEADLSENYAPGDTLSTATADAAVSQATARVYQGTVTVEDQIYENETAQVAIAESNLQADGDAEYVIVVHEMDGGSVGPAIGTSSVLSGQATDVTIDVDPINATTNVTAMLHEPGSPVGPAIPNADATGGFVAGNVADAAEVSIYDEQLAITSAPTDIQRGDDLSGDVTASVTADEVTTASTTDIQVDLVFEGLDSEAETVLGTETVTLAAGESETVTFTGLDPIPESTVASDGEPVALRVEANQDTAAVTTNLDNPIQQAVDYAGAGDTVTVLNGSYTEQVLVNKDLTLQGEADATIQAPENRTSFQLAEVDGEGIQREIEPVFFGFGGTLDGTNVTGTGIVDVTVSGLTVDGMERDTTGTDYFGMVYRNVDGTVQNNVVDNMTTGQDETGGIGVFGNSTLGIYENDVLQYERIGIVADGNSSRSSITHVAIENNTLRGPGVEVDGWAPNGIQIALGASGTVVNNTVTGHLHDSATPGGVLAFGSEDVRIADNHLVNNDNAVQVFGDFFFDSNLDSINTTVTGNTIHDSHSAGIIVANKINDTVITENDIRNNSLGLRVFGDDAGIDNLSFNWNNIVGNDDGVVNHYDHQLNATYNWWGDDSGPSGEGPGTGDSVSVNVSYDPWLDAPFDQGTSVTDDLSVQFTSPAADAERESLVSASAEVSRSLQVATQSDSLVTVEYVIDSEVVASKEVEVLTGETQTVTFQDVAVPGSATAAAPDNPEALDQTVRVVDEGATDTAGMSVTNPVQQAVDYAGTDFMGTVQVRSGTYAENVTVTVPGLAVEGPNAGTHGVGDRGPEATIDGHVNLNANGVVFDGLVVSPPNATENQKSEAIKVTGTADDVVVRNNVVRDFGEDGLGQWIGVDGIVAFGGDGTTPITNVTIVDNLVDGISGRDTDGGATGISIQGNVDGATVRNNTVNDVGQNETAWAFGLVVRGTGNHGEVPANVELRNNDVSTVFSNPSTSTVGVGLGSEANASEMLVRDNSIYDVELSAENKDTENTLDVSRNWWGDAHGPDTPENPLDTDAGPLGGAGDFTYLPWLDAPADQGGQATGPVENVDTGTFYLSIQNAVDNASSGDTLEAKTGTYEEEVTITVDGVTLQGVQSGGTGEDPTLLGAGGNGITVDASDVTVRNFTITGYSNGIRLTGAHSNIAFENVESVENDNRGIEVRNDADLQNLVLQNVNVSANAGDGLRVATESSIDGFTVRNSQFSDHLNSGSSGMEIYQSESNPGVLNDVLIEDTVINNNWQKGIYTEKLSNATLQNVTIDGIVSDTYGFNNGIDINLKYDDYENVTIRDSTVANVSRGDPYNDESLFSSAIAVKARDDPTGYDATPATLDDVTFDNVTVADSYNGLRVGEPGVDYTASPSGPTNVQIQNSAFVNNEGVHVADVPKDLDLNAILNDQGNAFDPSGVIVSEPGFDAIAPEVSSTDTIEVSTADQLRDAASGNYVSPDSVVQPGAEIVVVDDIDLGNEGVEVLVEDVTIRSESGTQYTVSLSPDAATSEKTFRVNADGATLRNLKVERVAAPDRDASSGFTHAIVIRNDTGGTISDVRIDSVNVVGSGFTDQNNRGVQVLDGTGTDPADATNITVVATSVSGFDGGLSAAAPYGGTVTGVTFHDNVVAGGSAGIDVSTLAADFSSQGGDVSDVTVTDNLFNSFDDGAFPVLEIANETEGAIDVLDFRSIFESNGNSFQKGALTFADPANDQVRTFTNPNFPGVEFAGISADIQTSVNVSEPGDTVEVLPGTYTEAVEVSAGLTIEGPNAGTPGYESAQRGEEATITQGVEINASDVTFDGLEVTSDDVNGIKLSDAPSNVVVTNSVVRDVSGSSAGSKSAGNGINLQFTDAFEQTSTGIVVTNNLVTNITTPDSSGDADAIGVQLLPRGNDVVDFTVTDNVIEDIEPGTADGRSEARAVSIDTQFTDTPGGTRGDFGQAQNLTIANNTVSNFTADFSRAFTLFEDADGDTTTTDALGPVNFTITENTVTGMDSTDGGLPNLVLFVGEYGDFGVDHGVQHNNFLAGVENFGGSSDALNATENWWGDETGPAGDGPGDGPGFVLETGGSEITFTPWLDAPFPGGQPTAPAENVDAGTFYLSIQNAVDDASVGDTIEVSDGTHEESVTINVDGLTLTAADGARPTITATTDVIDITGANDVTVSGLEITGSFGDNQGIVVQNGGSATVTDSGFADLNGAILTLSGSSNPVTVDNITVTDSVFGVGLQSDSNDVIRNSDIEVNTQGIGVFTSNNTLVENNTIVVSATLVSGEDPVFDTERGIDFQASNVTITDNEITSTNTSILSEDPGSYTVEDVSITNNTIEGADVHVDDQPNNLDLNTVLGDNTFVPDAEIQGDQIVPSS